MPCSVSFFDGAPEQVFDVLLSHLPFNRDVARLGASCSAAASALRLHLAALHRDFSLGAEPRHPVAVLPLPPCSIRPPVPLNFTYNAALGLWAGGGGLLTADDGCNATCACCNRNHAHRYFSMDWSSAAAGSTLGTGIAPAAAAAAAAGYQPDPARRPAQLHGGGGPARRRCHDQDRIETDGATHPCKEAAAQAMQTASKEQRSLMESDSDHRSTSRSRPISGGDGCSFSNRGLRKDCNDSAFVVVDGDSGGGSICDDVYGGYGQRDDAVILWCSCPCGVAVPSRQPAYDMKVGGLSPHLCTGVPTGGASAAYIMECGPACACSPACGQVHPRRPRECGWERGLEDTGLKMEAHGGVSRSTSPCPTRLTQGGLVVRVAIRWQEAKGWGVVALEPIPARRFICLYGGEYVTTTEAEGRLKEYDVAGQGHALLVI
ncbi:hypothetical protein Vretifemale_5776 [Volvox reticuliferus]|uniref:Uncharacterized protein n=1 Tax=Volvox reticuliferus TaxID=1737510 RepID=A0A8J4CBW2_9CHLO|nr:hypothetical protein Vretifemale_5776 [Volvox reticuliferus]